MKTTLPYSGSRILRKLAAAVTALAVSSQCVKAVPYASGITNDGVNVSYILNEPADNVSVIYDGGGAGNTNNLGAQSKGVHDFSLSGHTTYAIQVSKTALPGWFQISADTNQFNQYASPRGVAVFQNPADLAHFGRIFISDSLAGGTVSNATTHLVRTNIGKGLFLLNADQSDAVGRKFNASSNGISFKTGTSQSSPFRINIGEDNKLYVNCFATADATTYRSDLDCNNFEMVLAVASETNNTSVHTDSANKPIAKGSLENGNLQLWNLDGAYVGHFNGLAQWDIGAGPLPWNTAPTFVGNASAYSTVKDVTDDLELGPDGKWYVLVNRGIDDGVGALKVYAPDGATVLWSAATVYQVTTSHRDFLFNSQSLSISADGQSLAILRNDNSFVTYTLTNGIPDTNTVTVVTQSPTTASARAVAYDAAGNLYALSSGQALLRVFSPGGNTVATTSSDGTFNVVNLTPTVGVAASQDQAPEGGTPGTFTFTRTGDASAPLTVYYTVGGTATSGTDYTAIPTSVTFPASASSVDVPVAALTDALAESGETVILTLSNNTNYFVGDRQAVVVIVDNNPAVLALGSVSPSMYEPNLNDYVNVTITRNAGDTNAFIYVADETAFTFGGTAVRDVDYVVNTSVFPFYFNPGETSKTLQLIAPLDNSLLDGNRTVVFGLTPGQDYNVSPATATTLILDDEYPAETVLWSDDFATDTSANYRINFASKNPAATYSAEFAFDYAGLYGVPPSPHSNGETYGLHLNVNKDGSAAAAGVNVYPTNQSFGTNFALRFDMYLYMGSSAQSEYALFGINHTGAQTNWYRNNANGWTNSTYDGLWCSVEADASGPANASFDYLLFSAPRTTNMLGTTACLQPTIKASAQSTAFQEVFKSPPFSANSAGGSGSPSNPNYTDRPTWVDVELAQVGSLVMLRINHSLIFQYTNTTTFTNGAIMLGYDDAYDSYGNSLGVIYDNLRVVRLFPPTLLAQPTNTVAAAGGSATFSVVANSATGVTNYQWRFNGAPIAGATGSTLTINNVQFANYGTYSVVVDDGSYPVTSANATLGAPAPVINTQPVGKAAVIGSTPSFFVTATTYSGRTNYQWRFNGTAISGRTNSTLVLTNVQSTNFGPYTVVVSDGLGSVTSSVASLTLATPQTILSSASGSTMNLSFGTQVGPSYVVEYKQALTDPSWIPLSTNLGTGGTIVVTDSTTSAATRFYRIRMQ